jgi:hypothetical protein
LFIVVSKGVDGLNESETAGLCVEFLRELPRFFVGLGEVTFLGGPDEPLGDGR